MESSLRRAQKAFAKRGEAASVMCDAARAFIYDAMDRVEKEARTALAATAEGDTLVTQLAVLRRFAKHAAIDTIALRQTRCECRAGAGSLSLRGALTLPKFAFA